MKTQILMAAVVSTASLISFTAVAGESLPLKAVNKAGEVIDAALEAHGGAEKHEELNTLVQKSEYVTIATGQSRKPGPPYDRGKTTNFQVIDMENEIFVNHNNVPAVDTFLKVATSSMVKTAGS